MINILRILKYDYIYIIIMISSIIISKIINITLINLYSQKSRKMHKVLDIHLGICSNEKKEHEYRMF